LAETAEDFVNGRHYRVEKNKGCVPHPTRDNCEPSPVNYTWDSIVQLLIRGDHQ